MIYKVIESSIKGDWVAEAFDDDGKCFVVIFCGPDAEQRARDYARYCNDPYVWAVLTLSDHTC